MKFTCKEHKDAYRRGVYWNRIMLQDARFVWVLNAAKTRLSTSRDGSTFSYAVDAGMLGLRMVEPFECKFTLKDRFLFWRDIQAVLKKQGLHL